MLGYLGGLAIYLLFACMFVYSNKGVFSFSWDGMGGHLLAISKEYGEGFFFCFPSSDSIRRREKKLVFF